MLYLDYAKPLYNGKYILNFFADSTDDLEQLSHGKSFITKNGFNYGPCQPGSTVTITMPNSDKVVYSLDVSGKWITTETISYSEVVANPESEATEDLNKLKVNGITYGVGGLTDEQKLILNANKIDIVIELVTSEEEIDENFTNFRKVAKFIIYDKQSKTETTTIDISNLKNKTVVFTDDLAGIWCRKPRYVQLSELSSDTAIVLEDTKNFWALYVNELKLYRFPKRLYITNETSTVPKSCELIDEDSKKIYSNTFMICGLYFNDVVIVSEIYDIYRPNYMGSFEKIGIGSDNINYSVINQEGPGLYTITDITYKLTKV